MEIMNRIRSQSAKNVSGKRSRVGGVVGAGARRFELGNLGNIIRGGALSDAPEEFWEGVTVLEQNRRARRLRRNVELGNAVEPVFPQQLSDDRITCADGVYQAGKDVVAIN